MACSIPMDNNYLSFADLQDQTFTVQDLRPADSWNYDDTLKISHCQFCSFTGGKVYGGRENALDMNRECLAITVEGFFLYGGDQAAVVVKGGCRGIVIANTVIAPSRKAWCDIEFDGWSDQGSRHSTLELKNVVRNDGEPLRIVFGRFHRPTATNGTRIRVLWIPTIGLHAYNIIKGLFVKAFGGVK